ncbi:hypothetical protein C8R43DRAFT_1135403 [Mycena crocata]|nr:hypothetical protein C8R43DRAFT_1135403 [Mycena crocata]
MLSLNADPTSAPSLDPHTVSSFLVVVIAAHPPPLPTTTSTIPKPSWHLRNVLFNSISPSSSSPLRHKRQCCFNFGTMLRFTIETPRFKTDPPPQDSLQISTPGSKFNASDPRSDSRSPSPHSIPNSMLHFQDFKNVSTSFAHALLGRFNLEDRRMALYLHGPRLEAKPSAAPLLTSNADTAVFGFNVERMQVEAISMLLLSLAADGVVRGYARTRYRAALISDSENDFNTPISDNSDALAPPSL